MSSRFRGTSALLLALAVTSGAWGQSARFHMTGAAGFQLVGSQGDGSRFFGDPTGKTKGMIVVMPAQGILTPAKLAEANRTGWKDPTTDLRPLSPGAHQKIQTGDGSGYYFSCQGTVDGMQGRAFLAGLFGPSPDIPLLVLAFSRHENWPAFQGPARRMLDSIRLGTAVPEASPAETASAPTASGGTSAAAQDWRERLSGRRLKHKSSHSSLGYGGGPSGFSSSEFHWDLCSDGSYFFSEASSMSVGGGWGGSSASSRDSGRGHGTWRVVDGPAIVLAQHDGTTRSYRLSTRRNRTYNFDQVYFDGTPMFTIENESCR